MEITLNSAWGRNHHLWRQNSSKSRESWSFDEANQILNSTLVIVIQNEKWNLMFNKTLRSAMKKFHAADKSTNRIYNFDRVWSITPSWLWVNPGKKRFWKRSPITTQKGKLLNFK